MGRSKVMTQVDITEMYDFMRDKLTSEKNSDGLKVATYLPGWDDQVIAQHLMKQIPTINQGHVQRFRIMRFGQVPHSGGKDLGSMKRLTHVEKRLDAIEAWMKRFDQSFIPFPPELPGV